ncbi:MAG: ribosome silencing factor [Candidatus Cloacimonetes bacterium 4572_65]|nr:MAG: ribosome silencing factor [Candidatus Cloacimonetes bacterium 4572_65]
MQARELVEHLLEWAVEKKADNVKFYDLTGKTSYTDFIIIAEGGSDLHIRSIADNIVRKCKDNGIHINNKEGFKSSSWVLLDFVDVIVHVMTTETREFYKLDSLFTNIQQEIPEPIAADIEEEIDD